MRRIKEKEKILIIPIILIIAIAVGLYSTNKTFSIGLPTSLSQIGTSIFPSGTSAGISSYDPLSLSQISITGQNTNGFNGEYFIAQALLDNAGLNLVASPLGSQLVNLNNVSGTQQNQIQIKSDINQVDYYDNSGQSVTSYFMNVTPYPKSFSYKDCNLQTQTVANGGVPVKSDCIFNSSEAYWSYYESCTQANPNNVPVVINASDSLDNIFSAGTIANGTIINVPVDAVVECYTVNIIPYAQLWNVGSQAYNIQDTVSINNIALTVNTTNQVSTATYSNGTIALQARLLNPQIAKIPPTPSEIGSVFKYLTSPNGAYKPLGIVQSLPQGIFLISYLPSQTYVDLVNTQINIFNQGQLALLYNSQGQKQIGYQNSGYLVGSIANFDSQIFNLVKNASSASPYASYIDTSSIGKITTGGALQFNDPNGQYIQPVVQIISDFKLLGLSFVSATCSIQSASQTKSFNASSTGVLSITIQNTGQTAGGCSGYITTSNSDVSILNGEENTGTLQPQQTSTLNFQVTYNQYTNTTLTPSVEYHVCDTATNSNCVTQNSSITVGANCPPNTAIINTNTCQPLSNTAHPTTTVPQGGSNSTQKNLNTTITSNSGNSIGIGWYVLIAGIIIALAIYLSKKPRQPLNNMTRNFSRNYR